MARIAKAAFDGQDLKPMWAALLGKLLDGAATPGEGLDLALVAQLNGEKSSGLAIQHDVLQSQQLYRVAGNNPTPRLRVLALAAATDMGSNTPIEFLLEDTHIELMLLYVVPGAELPAPLPAHDVAIVIASDSEDCQHALHEIDAVAARWPRPLLNPPQRIWHLDRDKLHALLAGIEGLTIPATVPADRERLIEVADERELIGDIDGALSFPIIIRPRGSHAGVGLEKVDEPIELSLYLDERDEQEFFVSRFVDYASEDGQFRKYRVVFVDGTAYACHMAIARRWDIWYLNAGMAGSESKRLEEATFMQTFDIGFGRRHRSVLDAIAARIGLDYFIIDCAETRDGSLLVFEADNTAVVHNMDPPDVFPYKPPQMQKIFAAFAAMIDKRAASRAEQAA
ncbi:ATP-grasp domain-containing protein [Bradyrhizobium oligotrophicum]|uniref:ATP-grasp domain-containing protein n=1 Tax=Bradyrhizobium oligotrophicum TaxID=44255 RepID=UPI003EBA63D6